MRKTLNQQLPTDENAGRQRFAPSALAALLLARAACLAAAPRVEACINDGPMLQVLKSGLPRIDTIIAGGFHRPGADYYDARIRGLQPMIAERRDQAAQDMQGYLSLYDDLAVAQERFGESAQAIATMQAKRQEMERLTYPMPEIGGADQAERAENQWYTYYANIGTFRVHLWLAEHGDQREDLSGLQQAIDEIGQAVGIYPNAHDGREFWQLQIMRTLRDLPKPSQRHMLWRRLRDDRGDALAPDLLGLLSDADYRSQGGSIAAARGLAGLISMGAARQSVDVFYTLGIALFEAGEYSSGHFAFERAKELVEDEGKRFLTAPFLDRYAAIDVIEHAQMSGFTCIESFDQSQALRNGVRAWQDQQAGYIAERLREGITPADHERFWNDWQGDFYFLRFAGPIQHEIVACNIEGERNMGGVTVHIGDTDPTIPTPKLLIFIAALCAIGLLLILLRASQRRRAYAQAMSDHGLRSKGADA